MRYVLLVMLLLVSAPAWAAVQTPLPVSKHCDLEALKTEVAAKVPGLTIYGFSASDGPPPTLSIVTDRALTATELDTASSVVAAHVPTKKVTLKDQYQQAKDDGERQAILAKALGLAS